MRGSRAREQTCTVGGQGRGEQEGAGAPGQGRGHPASESWWLCGSGFRADHRGPSLGGQLAQGAERDGGGVQLDARRWRCCRARGPSCVCGQSGRPSLEAVEGTAGHSVRGGEGREPARAGAPRVLTLPP